MLRKIITPVLTLHSIYLIIAITLIAISVIIITTPGRRHRLANAGYWALLGGIFFLPEKIPYGGYAIIGIGVAILVMLDACGIIRPASIRVELPPDPSQSRQTEAHPAQASLPGLSSKIPTAILWPVLAIPVITFAVAFIYRWIGRDSSTGALIGLGVSGLVAMGIAYWVTSQRLVELAEAGAKLTEEIGPLNILPQLLAALGTLFTSAGVGTLLAGYFSSCIPANHPFLAGIVYFAAMTFFTAIMGNSFAAFAVITVGIGIPLVILPFSLDPAFVAILGLTAGSCGTLLSPMAANFNLLPAYLYEMKNPYGIIQAQWKFALGLWGCHALIFAVWLFFR
ncbi:MAG: DUF979 family protein [Acidobacteria bacterium]|nr:DUF979 family protein [Acidobacteriota bacterium]